MRPTRFMGVSTLAIVAACAASSTEDAQSARLAVVNGAADTTHASVVSIATSLDASGSAELCTGTVIAPRVVLTAGHCTLGQDPGSLIVGVGGNVLYPTSTLPAAAVVTYPDFTGSAADVAAGLDLGVVVLAADANLPSVPLYMGSASALVGSSLTLVGYGLSDASDEDTRGIRREGSVAIGGACSALLAFGDTNSNACHGDSGGPLLVANVDGGGESIVGVVSFGDDLHCATASYAVRVDRYATWLAAIIAGTGDAGSCASCPGAANDCAALEDAGSATDAGPRQDAGGRLDDAGVETDEAKGGGGCCVARRSSTDERRPWTPLTLAGLWAATRARRGRRRNAR